MYSTIHSHPQPEVRRVLIYRLGSLGDTIIALPCFHLIARTFPNAERTLLTNIPINAKAPAAAAVLGSSGLVHDYFNYPVGTRNPLRLAQLALTLRRYQADVLIYLAAPRGPRAIVRDARFFRLCGIRTLFGLPIGDLATNRLDPQTGLFESEAHRLARTLETLGDARVHDDASWQLYLTQHEKSAAAASTASLGDTPLIVCAPGCKASTNDWEDANWSTLFRLLSTHPGAAGHSLILTGADNDRARNDRLRAAWQGPSLNLCGNAPREAAALLSRARLYLGPDSGPMHIAAAVGCPCVSIFSARLPLGIWFPRGSQNQVLFHRTDCSPCGLELCTVEHKRCILTITPEQVRDACLRILQPSFRESLPLQAKGSPTPKA